MNAFRISVPPRLFKFTAVMGETQYLPRQVGLSSRVSSPAGAKLDSALITREARRSHEAGQPGLGWNGLI
jgi:hypothetical protein